MVKTLELSVLDQIAPCNWMTWSFQFDVESPEIETAVKSLNQGIRRLIKDIPPLAGFIEYVDFDSGRLTVKYRSDMPGLVFTVRDFRYNSDPWAFKYHPDPPSGIAVPGESTVPVMTAQANVFDEGILLGIHLHHSFTDGVGAKTIIKRWANICHALAKGRNPPSDVFDFDRSPIVSQVHASKSIADFKDTIHQNLHIRPPFSESQEGDTKTNYPVKCLVIEASALANLKANIMSLVKTVDGSASDAWISTNDALCAFLWHHISHARIQVASDVNKFVQEDSTLIMAVDVRSKMRLAHPDRYVGNAFIHIKCRRDIGYLSSTSLGHLAQTSIMIRQSVLDGNVKTVDSLIGALHDVEDFDGMRLGSGADSGFDVDLTSMLSMDIYRQDWGTLLGTARRLRRSGLMTPNPARRGGRDGFVRILPRKVDGLVEIELGMKHDALEVLCSDHEFLNYAREMEY